MFRLFIKNRRISFKRVNTKKRSAPLLLRQKGFNLQSMKTLVQAKNINKTYGDLNVLNNIHLEIKQGEIVTIVGPSGAGKTTLLQILGTLAQMDKTKGVKLIIDQQEVSLLSTKALARFRNQNIGFIFQFHELLDEFTALENVMLPGRIAGKSVKELTPKACSLLKTLGLANRLDHKPNALSGGEQQRVAVARALMNQPKIIFADEPSGNLDSENAQQLHELFFKLRDEYNITFVIVTHNPSLADMADRKIILRDGRIQST